MFEILDSYNFIRFDNFEDLPQVGAIDTIYLINRYKKSFYWNGSNYVYIRELNPDNVIRAEKGSPNGVAPLDGSGLVPVIHLPPLPVALNYDEYKLSIPNPPAGVWTSAIIGASFANKQLEITIENTSMANRRAGVRVSGSSNALDFPIRGSHTRTVLADGTGKIEIYNNIASNINFYVTAAIY